MNDKEHLVLVFVSGIHVVGIVSIHRGSRYLELMCSAVLDASGSIWYYKPIAVDL